MPKKRLSKAEGERLLAETKQRQRLLQEARTSERLKQLEIEACEEMGRQLRLEYFELSGELECQEIDTIRQYTLNTSDDEEDLGKQPKDGSSKIYSDLENSD
jgi:hypothetical protein